MLCIGILEYSREPFEIAYGGVMKNYMPDNH